MKVFPIFLNNLAGRRCVVFGNGHDAEPRVRELLTCDARVVLITPRTTDWLQSLAVEGRIEWQARDYRIGDLKDAFLAVATEINPSKTALIWEEAVRERVLMNAVDDVDHCTFVAGSIVRRGPLVLSISTSGTAPALSVRIREHLEKTYTQAHGALAELLGSLRPAMKAHHSDFSDRKRRWYELVDSDLLEFIEQGRHDEALQILRTIAGEKVAEAAPLSPVLS